MSFRDYFPGTLFINQNGVLPSELALVEPVNKSDVSDAELTLLQDEAKKQKWNWKTVNIYRRR